MMSSCENDQIVQVFKIVVVMREKDAMAAKCLGKMDRIVVSSHTDICRKLNVVARLLKQALQQCGGTVVIQIEPHNRFRRAISCGVKGLGWGWYL